VIQLSAKRHLSLLSGMLKMYNFHIIFGFIKRSHQILALLYKMTASYHVINGSFLHQGMPARQENVYI
jgi:hypothetical protein